MRHAAVAAVLVALAAGPARGAGSSGPQGTAPAPGAGPSAGPGGPSTAAPAKPPPPEASELARALLTADQWAKILDSYASSLASQVSQALLSSGEKVPEDLQPRLRKELGQALPYDQTVRAQADALSKELTPDELRRTAAFYRSAVGKKVLDRLPEAQSEVAHELQQRLATAIPDIVNRVAPKAMAGSPHGGPPASGAPGSSAGQSPPAQGRRPPQEGSGSSATQ